MAASESTLGLVHKLTTQFMLGRLQDEENPPTAAELSVIVKFLKDNGINADPEENPELQKLRAAVNDNVLNFPFKPNEA